MGQSLDSMRGQNHSKGELLHQLLHTGDLDSIKALCREGANLECVDREGKTPLIVACMDSGLVDVVEALIEMGANVHTYRPGRHAGTPLHHAAKRGLEQTVKLLLSSGANALARNDDCQTALDVARMKGSTNVARAIEHICYFSGWLRELYGPGFLGALAAQFLSRKVWVVVIPCGSSNPLKPLKLELAIYASLQDAQPRTAISLWNAKIEEPKFHHSDPGLTIVDLSTKNRYRFASANEGDKQQLRQLYDACGGIPQVMPNQLHHTRTSDPVIRHQASIEAAELAQATSASNQSTLEDRPPLPSIHLSTDAMNTNGWGDSPPIDSYNGWGASERPTSSAARNSGWVNEAAKADINGWGMPNDRPMGEQGCAQGYDNTLLAQTSGQTTASVSSAPSAPPLPNKAFDDKPIHYPSIDYSPAELSVPAVEHGASITGEVQDGDTSTSCIICWEAPVEGACIPCGHMAGCMPCLTNIKTKKGLCPVCRAKINNVIRLYAV